MAGISMKFICKNNPMHIVRYRNSWNHITTPSCNSAKRFHKQTIRNRLFTSQVFAIRNNDSSANVITLKVQLTQHDVIPK